MMKWLILLLGLVHGLYAASIDTKLFEGENREAYYQEVEGNINSAEHLRAASKEIVKEEKAYLAKLRALTVRQVEVDTYDLKKLSNAKSVTPEQLYNAVIYLSDVRLRSGGHRDAIVQLQEKISYTKQKLDDFVESDKPYLLTTQMQFALYKLQQKVHEQKIELLKTHDKEIERLLHQLLSRTECGDALRLEDALSKAKEEIERLKRKKVSVEIQRERELMEDTKRQELLQEQWLNAKKAYDQSKLKRSDLQITKALCLLAQQQNKPFFTLLGDMENALKSLPKELRSEYEMRQEVLIDLAKEVFGSTRLFFGATHQELLDLLEEVASYATATLFVFNEQPVNMLSLGKALLLIVVSFLIGAFYKRWILRIARRRPDISQMSLRLTSNIGYYLIVIVGMMVAIGSIGIDMTSISLIAGALSIGVGFGLQTVVSNLISGLILMFERTISIGDTVEIGDNILGRIVDMRMRSTTIKTYDNIDIVVPNSSFIQNNVVNWTLEDQIRRLRIPFGVAYGTKIEEVQQIVLEELKQSDLAYIRNDDEKQPDVWMVAMNSSSVDLELLVWVEWANKLRPNALKSDFLILIYNALYKHGIQIPFPQLDLHVKELPRGE